MKKIAIALLTCWAAFQVGAAEAGWTTDVPKAVAQAKTEKKLVLLDFTGSDWCGWCIKMHKDTFSKPEFTAYAKKNLELVELDFPRSKELPAALKKANQELQQKYKVNGFPTLVLLNGEGKEVWRAEGYVAGGPSAFIAQVEKVKKK